MHVHAQPDHARHDPARPLKASLVLTLLFFFVELTGGYLSNSLALLSDAGHMLGDLVALGLSTVSVYLARKEADPQKTYGYHRAEVLATLVNGALLLYVGIQIVIESLRRISDHRLVDVQLMLPIAVGGLLVNVVCAFLLQNHRENLATRSALFHVVSDLISSICVIVTGFIIRSTGWNWADLPASLLIAILIFRNAIHLLREVYNILMEASPAGIELEQVRKAVLRVPHVAEIHDLHVWSLGSGYSAASAHILVPNMDLKKADEIIKNVNRTLHDEFHIEHTTLQLAALPDPAQIQAVK